MKKVLLASTALIAFAGAAAADVALSGSAEIGVLGGDNRETQFHTHVDVTFTLSGETDGGISFGASVDLDEADNINGGSDDGVAIFISGDFGTLTLGDTDGALDWALTEPWVGNAGSIDDAETSHIGAVGSYADGYYDGQILRYDYSFGDFAAALSVELDDSVANRSEGFAIGARYSLSFGGGSVNLGAGYQFAETRPGIQLLNNTGLDIGGNVEVDIIGLSAAVSLDNGLQAGIQYTLWTLDAGGPEVEVSHLGLGAGYEFDAITVSANYGVYFSDDAAAVDDIAGIGFAAAYDLGGGLSAHLGYGNNLDSGPVNAVAEGASWSVGLAMSF